jgi:hypothetical protein
MFLDCSLYVPSLGQDVSVGGLLHNYTSEAHEEDQKDVLDYEKNCYELDLFLLHWGFELLEEGYLLRQTIWFVDHLTVIHVLGH